VSIEAFDEAFHHSALSTNDDQICMDF
jgi:hypothetical protein